MGIRRPVRLKPHQPHDDTSSGVARCDLRRTFFTLEIA